MSGGLLKSSHRRKTFGYKQSFVACWRRNERSFQRLNLSFEWSLNHMGNQRSLRVVFDVEVGFASLHVGNL